MLYVVVKGFLRAHRAMRFRARKSPSCLGLGWYDLFMMILPRPLTGQLGVGSVATQSDQCTDGQTWWIWSAMIRLPPACKAGALPIELQTHMKTWKFDFVLRNKLYPKDLGVRFQLRCIRSGQGAPMHPSRSAFPYGSSAVVVYPPPLSLVRSGNFWLRSPVTIRFSRL